MPRPAAPILTEAKYTQRSIGSDLVWAHAQFLAVIVFGGLGAIRGLLLAHLVLGLFTEVASGVPWNKREESGSHPRLDALAPLSNAVHAFRIILLEA